MHTANEVANYFINKNVCHLKLQKLLYYSQVWYFKKNGELLFNDKIKAWIYGPVVSTVWNDFKYMKGTDIIPLSRTTAHEFTDDISKFLDEVWSAYGHLTASDLVDLTHLETPWMISRKGVLNHEPSDKEVIINHETTIEFELNHLGLIPKKFKSNSIGTYSNY